MRSFSLKVLACLLASGLLLGVEETRTVVVPGNAAWMDTGIEVIQGARPYFLILA